jgi:hypothetical protein
MIVFGWISIGVTASSSSLRDRLKVARLRSNSKPQKPEADADPGFVALETEDCRRGLRYDGLRLGLVELTEERLFHVRLGNQVSAARKVSPWSQQPPTSRAKAIALDACSRGLRYDGLRLGLVELTEERLFHVAEAGSLGGGTNPTTRKPSVSSEKSLTLEPTASNESGESDRSRRETRARRID